MSRQQTALTVNCRLYENNNEKRYQWRKSRSWPAQIRQADEPLQPAA
jgi:hypothetical protein